MKANTPELLKFKRLQRRLGVTTAAVVGHLELLWLSTAKNAPEGDIGRFSNEEIAIGCYWDGDPDDFVKALVECGWIDADDTWRLLVHDWPEHAPTYVHGFLKRHKREFKLSSQVTKEAAKQPTKEPAKEATIATSYLEPPTKPSLVKPSQAKPSEAESSSLSFGLEKFKYGSCPDFLMVWGLWKRKCQAMNHRPLDESTEASQLYELDKVASTLEEAIAIVSFSCSRTNAKNLITTGEHRKATPQKREKPLFVPDRRDD